ncbi:cysteine desulfurase, mitosomal [Vittaforma corneae ATCC 50505]|uniref:Cysteine desulfurase, mitosomal n=1 Tax=Vittaforma corneae (strain ATCC 50505) TaxID=993615 RepID=L2GMN8_VITCO|nr:cysteine desulfurase, mitosomal [Vittaforma corneae ATCC 50505]ELA42086.1 cysteine desulfurase, mitosomal [Vittaforma corneae ATCC 50505]
MIPTRSESTGKDTTLSTISKDVPTRRYFDFQATTPVDPRVLDAMLPYLTSFYGNPHSRSHSFGWEAEKATENSRKQVADLVNADPKRDYIYKRSHRVH